MSDTDKTIDIDKIIQAAIEVRTSLTWYDGTTEGGEIQYAEAMSDPVAKLVEALNSYQLREADQAKDNEQILEEYIASKNPQTQAEILGIDDMPAQTCKSCNKNPQSYHDRVSIRRSSMCAMCRAINTPLKKRDEPAQRKHSHYFKDISKFDEMDTYLFCRIWKIQDDSGALHHALKKLMDAGKRGNKDKLKDIAEARDTLNRYLEIESMFAEASE